MKLPCQSRYSPFRWSLTGAFTFVPVGSGPPPGGLINGGATWTVSNFDNSGLDISANFAALVVGTVLVVQTPTGSAEFTLTAVPALGAESAVLTGTTANVQGALNVGQITGLWRRLPSALPCPPVPPVVTIDYCVYLADGELDEYLAEHPDEVQAAYAYIDSHCPPPPPPPPWCEWTARQMATFVDNNPDMADEIYCYIRDNCPNCESINWLLGYLSARDPGTYPPGEDA